MVNRRDIFKYVAAVAVAIPATIVANKATVTEKPKDIRGPTDTDSRKYDKWLDTYSKDSMHLD